MATPIFEKLENKYSGILRCIQSTVENSCLFCCQGFTWPCDFPATIAQPDSQMTARLEVPWPGHGYGFCHGRSSETTATSYPNEILALWVAVVIGHLGYEALKSVVAEWTF